MGLKTKVEAIIYAADEPVSLEHIATQLRGAVPLVDGAEPTDAHIKSAVRAAIEELVVEYASAERAMEVRQVAGGYRMATKPEHHDVVRAFAKSLKPPVRLSLQSLETLAVIAYKQPITIPEISEIRGVDSSGVIATLLDRKLVTTAGRKAVIGRPILYKTTREFLLRFGLRDINELPSMEEFEKLAGEALGLDTATAEGSGAMVRGIADATGVPEIPEEASEAESQAELGAALEGENPEAKSAPAFDDDLILSDLAEQATPILS